MQNKVIKLGFLLLLSILIFSCDNKKTEKKVTQKVEIITATPDSFDMYKTSEMAELMRTMLEKNKQVKANIIAGKDLGEFSKEYITIHSAVLTDPSDRNASFETFSNLYIKNMKDVFTVDKTAQKTAYNTAIQSCIACHKTTCAGPIPRIKKLLIN